MNFAIGVITHTPLWAWAILAYLIWQGLQATRPRTTSIWRLMIVPAVFIVMGLSRIALRPDDPWGPLAGWLPGAAVFLPLGLLRRQTLLAVDRKNMRVTRPGSKTPLI